MGTRGVPAKPTAVRTVGDGDKRPGRSRKKEPKPNGEIGNPPDYLTTQGKAIWRAIVKSAPAGLYTAMDRDMLGAFCQTKTTFEIAAKSVNKLGAVVPDRDGSLKKNPAAQIQRDALQDMIRLGDRLGLTPSGRATMTIGGNDGDGDKDPSRLLTAAS